MSDSIPSEVDPLPLVYHFTGNTIPAWGIRTLRGAQRTWPGSVVVIHDQVRFPAIPGVHFEHIDPWYDSAPFDKFAEKFERPSEFRGGFWFHAVERFFVLAQWAEHFGVTRFIHTELDVVIMGCEKLIKALPQDSQRLYIPRASPRNAGANFLYVDGPKVLAPLVDFFTNNAGAEYEMGLLARFLDECPNDSVGLPSHFNLESEFSYQTRENHIGVDKFGGVIDVQPIGTWIFGQDPRNEKSGSVFNHYYYQNIGSPRLKNLKYRYYLRAKQLFVRAGEGNEYPVYALHVHSKAMRRAHSPVALFIYSWLSNLPWRTVIVIQNLDQPPKRAWKLFLDKVYLGVFRPLRARIKFGDKKVSNAGSS